MALKRAPKKTHVPGPAAVRWRGATGEGGAFADAVAETPHAGGLAAQIHKLLQEGKPEEAQTLLSKASAGASLPQSEIDRLQTQLALDYLAEAKDDTALSIAESGIANGSSTAAQDHWVAGLASYRLGHFDNAARHFEDHLRNRRRGANPFRCGVLGGAQLDARGRAGQGSGALQPRRLRARHVLRPLPRRGSWAATRA